MIDGDTYNTFAPRQGELFTEAAAIDTIPSPWCIWERCKRNGRATVGAWEPREGCRNREIVCTRCGCFGHQSENLERKPSKRKPSGEVVTADVRAKEHVA